MIHYYYFDEDDIDIEFFKRVILATAQMGTGINNNKSDATKVYPNPANDFITITNSTNEPGNCLLHLFDIYGRLVLAKEFDISDGYRLNISEMKNGVYLMDLHIGNKQFSKKVIKTDF